MPMLEENGSAQIRSDHIKLQRLTGSWTGTINEGPEIQLASLPTQKKLDTACRLRTRSALGG